MSQARIPPPPKPGRDARGYFQQGMTGTPGGRPKSVGEVRRLAREQTELAIQVLVEVATDRNAAPAARVAACSILLDRGYGKAVQPVELGGPGAFDQLTTEELEAYVLDRARLIVEGRQ